MTDESFNHFPEIVKEFHDRSSKVVRKCAFDIESRAKANIQTNHSIITGNMMNSVYTVTDEGDHYPGQGDHDLAPNEIHLDNDVMEAYVAVAASYAIYVEFGAQGRPAKPYLVPAAEAIRPVFEEVMSRLESWFEKNS